MGHGELQRACLGRPGAASTAQQHTAAVTKVDTVSMSSASRSDISLDHLDSLHGLQQQLLPLTDATGCSCTWVAGILVAEGTLDRIKACNMRQADAGKPCNRPH